MLASGTSTLDNIVELLVYRVRYVVCLSNKPRTIRLYKRMHVDIDKPTPNSNKEANCIGL